MQKKKLFNINTCGLILIGLLIFCTTSIVATAYPVSVQDSNENHLKFSKIPRRVVSLVPSATQILFKIGAKDFVKGITYHDITLAGAASKQIIGGFFLPSLDKIEAAKPDMIILSSIHKDIIKRFEKTDCKLFFFKTRTIEDAFK